MKRTFFCALAMCIPVSAQILMPEGKGLPVVPDFTATYLKAETQVWFTYLRPGMSELESIMRWKQSLPPNRFTFDSQTKMLRSREKATITRSDSAGLAVRILMNGEYDAGAKIFTLLARGFDSLGRRVVEYTFDAAAPSAPVDSTRWVWRHAGCADEERDDGAWEWTVDAEGRCLEGLYRVPDTARPGNWVEDHRLLLSWQAGRLVQASEWVARRQVSREEYVYVGDRVEAIKSYNLLEDGGFYLAEKTTVSYMGNQVDFRSMEAFDVDGTRYALSSLQPTGASLSSVGSGMASAGLRVRAEAGDVLLENGLSESVQIRFSDPSGRSLGGISLEPGAQSRWSPRSGGMVFWSARGGSFQASGKALVSR